MTFPRDVSGLSTKLLLAAIARAPWKPSQAYLPLINQRVRDPYGLVSTFSEIFFDDIYRPVKPLPSHAQVVDVGAHYGMFALYAARRLSAARVVSFEPNPHTFEVLSENVNATDLGRERIVLHNAAVTLDGADVQMLIKDNNKTSVDSSVVHREALDEPTHLIDVKSVSIADAIGNRCDLLKFDAEGVEYDVLLHDAIHPGRVGQIATEIHRIDQQQQKFYRLIDTLCGRGYQPYDREHRLLSRNDIERMAHEQSTLVMHFA